ncbi:growth hormone inducible transmembrane protein [Loa loa]|uniref:Growth hormone inducible transmembrane protein n=1 Tax=Loa loa TaxID=7209 RepID=A0A1I7VUU7_LOALO|nr:growth hormone inducible transmembrane protein [Loa loa]EFO20623.1 growth hormone inducible transmembrane protein [Loa loa]
MAMLSRLFCGSSSLQLLNNVAFRYFSKTTYNTARYAGRRVAEGNYGIGSATRTTLKERFMGPTTGKPYMYGSAVVAGASLLGVGALCYYGLGLSKEGQSILVQSGAWPVYVRDRIKATYGYLFASLGITAASAVMTSRSFHISRLIMGSPFISMAAVMASGIAVSLIDYDNTLLKHAAWILHAGMMGTFIGPVCLMGGPLAMRAAWYTAAIVAGLSTVAFTAPSEKFLMMGGALAMGLGVVFASSIGTFFLPPTSALGASLMSISIYGGLILFSLFLLFDTQLVIKRAQMYPISNTSEEQIYKTGYYGSIASGYYDITTPKMRRFDPINAQLSIYSDVLNIFIRLATIMMGMQSSRKR